MENTIYEELKLVSPVIAEAEKKNIFSVPPLYFENFANTVVCKIHTGVEPVYYLTNVNPYSVPAGYFQSLSENILQKIKGEKTSENEVFNELEAISPLLNTISKKAVFSVPDGYFQRELPVVTETNLPLQAKVLPMRSAAQKIMRYAVAAVVFCILALGAYLLVGKGPQTLQDKNSITSTDVKNLSEQEIVEFLKKNAPTYEVSAFSDKEKEQEIHSAVKEMTDKEIQQFLQDNLLSDEI